MDGLSAIPGSMPRTASKGSKLRRFRSAAVTMLETVRLSLDALRAHKLRSFLTLLGVILAVTTLVAVMSVVAGLNFYVADKIANLGANVYVLTRFGIITSQDAWVKAQKRPLVTTEEFTKLRAGMRTASQVAALLGTSSDLRYGNDLLQDVNILGVTPNYSEVRSLNVASGRFLMEADETHHSPVCFIGGDVQQGMGHAARFPRAVYPGTERGTDGGLRGRSSNAPAGVAAHSLERSGQLRDCGFGLDHGAMEIFDREFVYRGGGADGGIPGGRRNRDHEHHAGERDGTHAGDRSATIAGSEKTPHRSAVRDGIGGAGGHGRADRNLPRVCAGCSCARGDGDTDEDPDELGDTFAERFDGGGSFLRDLPGDARGKARSHRSTAGGGLRNGDGTSIR